MIIQKAEFVKSAPDISRCPPETIPEYAFIGRSNVGKSSLINMLVNCKNMAKTSVTPGKTRLFNYFLINDTWYLVDLPGLGYAKISKNKREEWKESIGKFLLNRKTLLCSFLLVDCRHEVQAVDEEIMEWMAEKGLPFVIVFTKTDKLPKTSLNATIQSYKNKLLETWEELPKIFLTSSEKKQGREELLSFIEETNLILSSYKK
ncbi:MAG: ribosome biogenesis GTP-binding protein YihA/YsxC [Bacteroidales bacterium]|nr:ribosome biogenesis GTP-binding protein YihA/YsxC [Bacteroidales bacterium]